MGWILETNEPMNRAMEGMGGTSSRSTGSRAALRAPVDRLANAEAASPSEACNVR